MEHINETEWNEYLAGVCGDERRVWIDEHVKSCPECRKTYESVSDLEQALSKWQVDASGHDVSLRVTQAVAKESLTSSGNLSRTVVSYVLKIAAVIVVGVLLGWLTGQNSADTYIAQQQGRDIETQPGYLAVVDLQFASALTWSVLDEAAFDAMEQQ